MGRLHKGGSNFLFILPLEKDGSFGIICFIKRS